MNGIIGLCSAVSREYRYEWGDRGKGNDKKGVRVGWLVSTIVIIILMFYMLCRIYRSLVVMIVGNITIGTSGWSRVFGVVVWFWTLLVVVERLARQRHHRRKYTTSHSTTDLGLSLSYSNTIELSYASSSSSFSLLSNHHHLYHQYYVLTILHRGIEHTTQQYPDRHGIEWYWFNTMVGTSHDTLWRLKRYHSIFLNKRSSSRSW